MANKSTKNACLKLLLAVLVSNYFLGADTLEKMRESQTKIPDA
jgi:hypothetical protein